MKNSSDDLWRDHLRHLNTRLQNRRRWHHRPLIYTLSKLLIPLSYAILVSLILILVTQSFTTSVELGIRSLVAAVLPPLITTYFSLFKHLFRHPIRIGKIPLYLFSTGWAIAISFIINFLSNHTQYSPNWGIFLLSITLSELAFSRKYISYASLLSCCFGIVTGVLVYFLLFGFIIH